MLGELLLLFFFCFFFLGVAGGGIKSWFGIKFISAFTKENFSLFICLFVSSFNDILTTFVLMDREVTGIYL